MVNKYLKAAVAYVKSLGSSAKAVYKREPARVLSVITAVVVFVCAKTGVVVPAQSIGDALAFALPILLGGEAIRSQVSPAAVPVSPAAPVK